MTRSPLLAITADVHAHNYLRFAQADPSTGLNSRLLHCCNALRSVTDWCLKNKVSRAVCAGDLFHRKNILSVEVKNAVYDELSYAKASGVEWILMPGNHDMTRGGGHSIYSFGKIATVIDSPSFLDFEEYELCFIPYQHYPDEFRTAMEKIVQQLSRSKGSKPRFLFGHQGFEGGKAGPCEYQPPEPLKVSSTRPDLFTMVFMGHYHEHQWLADNVCYIGSPVQIDFGERGQRKGFLSVDWEQAVPGVNSDVLKVNFRPLDSPQFHVISGDDPKLPALVSSGDYIRAQINHSSQGEELLHKLKTENVSTHNLIFEILDSGSEASATPSSSFTIGEPMEAMIDPYVDEAKPGIPGVSPRELKDVGEEILREAMTR